MTNEGDDRSTRRTPADGPEDWEAIWATARKAHHAEGKLRKLSWYFALHDNWKSLLFGIALAAIIGGKEFIANVTNALEGIL